MKKCTEIGEILSPVYLLVGRWELGDGRWELRVEN
jgi:hypothetical protein